METSYVIFLGLPKRGNQSVQCELAKHFMVSSSILNSGRCRVSLLEWGVGKRMSFIHAVEAGENRFPTNKSKKIM